MTLFIICSGILSFCEQNLCEVSSGTSYSESLRILFPKGIKNHSRKARSIPKSFFGICKHGIVKQCNLLVGFEREFLDK
jgi:hypothetical protein